MGGSGGITRHLAELEARIVERLKWETYQQLIQDNQSGLNRMRPQDIFPEGEPEQVPEVYELYQQCKTWGKWWGGGLADQPHILMAEFDACERAELRFKGDALLKLQELDAMGRPKPTWRDFLTRR